MLENVTIDSIMKEYYHAICSDELSENKIDIDENLEIEDSASKYLQLFACFLNESYYRGYVISQSIFKRLMDIIEFEGYEYQIIEKYIDILFNSMIDYNPDKNNRPEYRKIVLDITESKAFINEYLKSIQSLNDSVIVKSTNIPHFKNPESEASDLEFNLYILNEVEYPVDIIYKNISNNTVDRNIDYAKHAYVVYNSNFPAYKNLVSKIKSPYLIFFLLDSNNDQDLDLLVENVTSLPQLATIIRIIEESNMMNIDNFIAFRFNNDTINNNIRRLIELLTINISIEQTAMIIGNDYDLWRQYCDENYHELATLLMAVNLYQSDPERFNMIDPIRYIYKIKECYPNDKYFYYRNTLLNMDYKLFFDNFIIIFEELLENITKEATLYIIQECFDGFINLKNKYVDNKLIELYDRINEINNQVSDTIIINTENDLFASLNKKPKWTELFLNNFNIKYCLLNRNGEFDPAWINYPTQYDTNIDYSLYSIDKFLKDNTIYKDKYDYIQCGSIFRNVKTIEAANDSFNIYSINLDEKFNICNRDNAVYIAKYAKTSNKNSNFELLMILGDDNYTYKFNDKLLPILDEYYLIGLYNITESSFIYGRYILDNERTKSNILYNYCNQLNGNINYAEIYIINKIRDDIYAYYIEDDEYLPLSHQVKL